MRVDDLDRTVRFNEQTLGLKGARRMTSARGAQLAFIQTPPSDEEIEIGQLPHSPPVEVQPDLLHRAFEVENLAAVAAEFARRGGKLSDGPTRPDPNAIVGFSDAPEGYEIG